MTNVLVNRIVTRFAAALWLTFACVRAEAQLAPLPPIPTLPPAEPTEESADEDVGETVTAATSFLQPFIATLAQAGVEPSESAIRQWLRQMEPDKSTEPKQRALIARLGSPDYYQREAAVSELLKLSHINPELFAESLASPDLEVRWRAENIVKAFARKPDQSRLDDRLHAAYQLIQRRKMRGLAREVLIGSRFCKSERSHRLAERALLATVSDADADVLGKSLVSSSTSERRLGVLGLSQLDQDALRKTLLPLLADDAQQVRLAAATSLAQRGDRAALAPLVDLLSSQTLEIRARAAQDLRVMTGQQFEFYSPATVEERKSAVAEWQSWLKVHGDSADLKPAPHVTKPQLGRTLICERGSNRVLELDARGKVVFEVEVRTPVSCQGLLNGHRLVASYDARQVLEYDETGRIVWQKSGLPGRPFSVRRLENGNTLVACTNSRSVVEIRPDGLFVKSYSVPGDAMDARRLENGWTAVAVQKVNQIVELNPTRRIHWRLSGFATPRSVQPLLNGNLLVAEKDAGKVVEITREGKAVWSVNGLWGPCDAQRLPNGNTLIVESKGVREVNRVGKTVWEHKGKDCIAAHRF